MINLYIVDDERLVVEDIKLLFDWNTLNCKIIGSNTVSEIAYKEILELKPQIVLCDINMPILNGLDLYQKVKTSNANIDFIFITAYGEFNYIQSALSLGAFDYLLKPISYKEVKKVLLKYFNKNIFNFFVCALEQNEDDCNFANIILQIGIYNYNYLCISSNDISKLILYNKVRSIKLIELYKGARTIFIISFNQASPDFIFPNDVINLFALNKGFLIGTSSLIENFEKIKQYYSQANIAFTNSFITGHTGIYMYKRVNDNLSINIARVMSFITKDELVEFLQELVVGAKNNLYSYEYVTIIFNAINKVKGRLGIDLVDIDMNQVKDMYDSFENFVNSIIMHLKINNNIKALSKSIVDDITEILEKRYREKISINIYAKEHGYNPSYLSQIFKQIKGITFSEYLIALRLNKAIELFKERDLTLLEISEILGYTDYFHFSKQFKKKYGVPPTIYREGIT